MVEESTNVGVLRCLIDAPEPMASAARYTIATLLRPLRLRPEWTTAEPSLYYGPSSRQAPAPGRVEIVLQDETAAYFARREAYDRRRSFEADALPFLFGTPDEPDLIASAFFLLSGWEEHVQPARDEHGRFCYAHSMQRQLGVPLVPLVDCYRDILSAQLRDVGVSVERRMWGGRSWAFFPTFDIDYLREWRPGTVVREIGRRPLDIARGLLTGQDAFLDGFFNLLAVLSGAEAAGTFFMKSGDRSAYDPAYRRSSSEVKRLLGMIREQGSEIGLHPGYYSATHADYLHEERTKLEEAAEQRVWSVRQHYLRYELPRTARLHAAEGFELDSTLAFPDHEGFRRGTCLPFKVYDPAAHRSLDVWEMPLCFMDVAMVHRRGMSAEEAGAVLRMLMETCRERGGACVALWHNVLWERGMEGWPEQLTQALAEAAEGGAWLGALREGLHLWQM